MTLPEVSLSLHKVSTTAAYKVTLEVDVVRYRHLVVILTISRDPYYTSVLTDVYEMGCVRFNLLSPLLQSNLGCLLDRIGE